MLPSEVLIYWSMRPSSRSAARHSRRHRRRNGPNAATRICSTRPFCRPTKAAISTLCAARGKGSYSSPSPGGSLEGEGRLTLSAAKSETGWGDLSTRALFEGKDCHPTPPLISFASTLPLQAGESHVRGAKLLRWKENLILKVSPDSRG